MYARLHRPATDLRTVTLIGDGARVIRWAGNSLEHEVSDAEAELIRLEHAARRMRDVRLHKDPMTAGDAVADASQDPDEDGHALDSKDLELGSREAYEQRKAEREAAMLRPADGPTLDDLTKGADVLECAQCDETFPSGAALNRHVEMNHAAAAQPGEGAETTEPEAEEPAEPEAPKQPSRRKKAASA